MFSRLIRQAVTAATAAIEEGHLIPLTRLPAHCSNFGIILPDPEKERIETRTRTHSEPEFLAQELRLQRKVPVVQAS